jgi:PAS domain S-box-containing protein
MQDSHKTRPQVVDGPLDVQPHSKDRCARADTDLRASEERYRQAVENSPNPIFSINTGGKIQTWNRSCERVFQYVPEEIIGQPYHILLGNPEDRLSVDSMIARVFQKQILDDVDLCYRCKDGTRRCTLSRLYPLLDWEGRVEGCVFANTDITDRAQVEEALRQRNRELELFYRASQVFISSLDLDQVLSAILEEIRGLFGVAACSAWLVDRATGEVVCRQATGERSEQVRGWRLAPGQGIAGWVARTGESQIVPDTHADPRHFQGVARTIGLTTRSILSVPLRVRQEIIGALQVVDTQVDRFTPSDLRLIESLAGVASIVIENARLYEETARLRDFNQNIVQSMAEGITVEDADGCFTFVNPAAAAMLGYTPEELLGQNWTIIVPPDQHSIVEAANRRRARGEADQYEVKLVARNGARIPVLISGSPRFQDGEFNGTLAVFTNIAERVKAEGEIHRRNRELTLLNQIIATAASDLEPEAILETACRELARAFDLPQAAAAMLNEKKSEAVIVAEYRAEGQLSALNRTIPVVGNPSFQYILANKTPLVVEDAQNDPRLEPIHDLMCERGTASLLILPLIVEGEVVGSLGLDAIEVRRFSAEDVSLAWSVADQVSVSLAHARLHEQRQRLEAQYRQAQKMEAVGHLAAGIAHDFNNLLTAINGFAELAQLSLATDDPVQELIGRILASGRRGGDLVRQLLVFSRKQIIQPRVIDLNTVVTEMDKMLRYIIGENIQLETHLATNPWPVKVDPAQIEQVIVNLAVNARDAMPSGGRLTVETANVTLDASYAAYHLEAQPGDYVLITVSDTGIGMTDEVKAHLFEPFFTTKEVGKGTGLGLATVYGIVKQSGGHIWVYSEEGEGTTFKIYLPRATSVARPPSGLGGIKDVRGGEETILVVEDNDEVRDLALRMLAGQGYTMLEARNGQEALQISAGYTCSIHLLLTDIVMPGISGKDLAQQLSQARPGLKVLFMSGYSDIAFGHHQGVETDNFLQKPFSPMDLARKVRAVLDGQDSMGRPVSHCRPLPPSS